MRQIIFVLILFALAACQTQEEIGVPETYQAPVIDITLTLEARGTEYQQDIQTQQVLNFQFTEDAVATKAMQGALTAVALTDRPLPTQMPIVGSTPAINIVNIDFIDYIPMARQDEFLILSRNNQFYRVEFSDGVWKILSIDENLQPFSQFWVCPEGMREAPVQCQIRGGVIYIFPLDFDLTNWEPPR